VYLEWIHPFGDGNGRTGRLLEFYILLRAGLPNIVSHVLSNFYNKTRTEYYRQLKVAKEKKDLTHFIEYAITGFRDGLVENLNIIQEHQSSTFWHNYIYEIFSSLKYTKKEAFQRKRELILQLPTDKFLSADEMIMVTPIIAQMYSKVNKVTVLRDIKELIEFNLLKKEGRKFKANIEILRTMIPLKKQ
jgi:Fic family protein